MSHGQHAPVSAADADFYPAGAAYSKSHHGHTIVPLRLLVVVLGLLLFFTLLTVGAAQAEQWIAHTFDIVIPQWVNVFVALSIATVKTVIVAMYFMQLRYDNPLNAIVLFFTVVVVAIFLGFTMLDLGNRKIIYDYKGQRVEADVGRVANVSDARTPGGIGNVPAKTDPVTGAVIRPGLAAGQSLASRARERAEQRVISAVAAGTPLEKRDAIFADQQRQRVLDDGKPLPEYLEKYWARREFFAKAIIGTHYDMYHGHDHTHGADGPSSPDQSRPVPAAGPAGAAKPAGAH